MERIGRVFPTEATREGRMLAGGRLTVTITSKATNTHVTLRLRCARKDQSGVWSRADFADASHVFIEDYDGQRVATYYPVGGCVYWNKKATVAARWSALALLRYLSGEYPMLPALAWIDSADFCGRCGQELTDPVSIERGYGPDCYGLVTRSRSTPALAA